MIKDTREIIRREEYDVIVVGGGIAGVSAAVTAARRNMRVLLIEKSINLGGLATLGLISWYEPLCDGRGEQVIFGMAEELIKLAFRYGFENLPERWGGSGKSKPRNERYSSFYSPTVFALALDEFVLDAGVKLRFDTLAVQPVMKNGSCEGVLCESANGREYFPCKVIIDATGDASVCHRAGMPTVVGENYLTYIAHGMDATTVKKCAETGDFCRLRAWQNAGSDMLGNGHPQGMRRLTGISAEDITDFVTVGKSRMLDRIKEKDQHSYDILTLPTMPQFRTVRRIVGKKDFCAIEDDRCGDSIGLCGDFRMDRLGKRYHIPFGALYHPAFSNILAAGRIISSPRGDGWEVARVIPVCALTGEAAGNAAALMASTALSASKINIKELQKQQSNNGILL